MSRVPPQAEIDSSEYRFDFAGAFGPDCPIDDSWKPILGPALSAAWQGLEPVVGAPNTLPARADIMNAFALPVDKVRVLILGQDPYPTPGHPMGLAFSTQPGVAAPRSLRNIYQELSSDLGITINRQDGDLSRWQNQGVMLLNRVLSVEAGNAGSHRRRGWEGVTEAALRALDRPGMVAILWGKDAQSAQRFMPSVLSVCSPHPSPLSAHRGFFGSRPFSQANKYLEQAGADPVDWRL